MAQKNIMVVEDEGLVALEIKESLESMGYSVCGQAASGEAAIQQVLSDPPDLILMDIRLEGEMDGIQTAKQIRENHTIPIIFLTAHSDEKTLERAKLTESYGYILKPFEDRALKAAIEIALYKADSEMKIKGDADLLSVIFRSMTEGVIVTNTKGDIRFINDYASKLTGLDPLHIHGKRIHDFIKDEDPVNGTKDYLPFSATIMEGRVLNNQSRRLHINNERSIQVDYSIAPLKSQNDLPIGIVFLFSEWSKGSKKKAHEDLQTSEPIRIQKQLLPKKNVSYEGFKVNWLFRPSAFGSGDLFNFFPLGNGHVGFYLLDVMGHGFSAAIFSVLLHKLLCPDPEKGGILRRPLSEEEHPKRRRSDRLPSINTPSRVLSELNKRFFFGENGDPFFTIVYGIIDTESGQVRMSKAGHIPPLLHRGSFMEKLEPKGYAIGLYRSIELEEKIFSFEKGDRLYLYSDGLIESTNRYMSQFSDERLIDFLRDNRETDLNELVDKLEKTITEWRDNKQFDDDVAFLVLERV